MFSDKIKSSEKITLVEGDKMSMQDAKDAEILNIFFLTQMKT